MDKRRKMHVRCWDVVILEIIMFIPLAIFLGVVGLALWLGG